MPNYQVFMNALNESCTLEYTAILPVLYKLHLFLIFIAIHASNKEKVAILNTLENKVT